MLTLITTKSYRKTLSPVGVLVTAIISISLCGCINGSRGDGIAAESILRTFGAEIPYDFTELDNRREIEAKVRYRESSVMGINADDFSIGKGVGNVAAIGFLVTTEGKILLPPKQNYSAYPNAEKKLEKVIENETWPIGYKKGKAVIYSAQAWVYLDK